MKQKLILATLLMGCLFCSCHKKITAEDNSEEKTSFIHYTSDTLDSVTAANMQRVKDSKVVLEPINMEEMGALTYEQYAMTHPDFSTENKLDSIIDNRGFKTMILQRKSGDYNCNVIYIHGGAFTFAYTASHRNFCEALLKKLNAKIVMPLYPLAPNYTVSDTFEMLLSIYKELLKEGKPIYIMGDSAGGNITLCFTGYLHTLDLQMPTSIIPISPAVDYTMSNPKLWKINKTKDIVLGGQLLKQMTTIWADKDMSSQDPKINALNINLQGFPPTLFYTGTDESFYPDILKMYQLEKKAGIRVGMLVGQHLWHVSVASDMPAREMFINEILNFIE